MLGERFDEALKLAARYHNGRRAAGGWRRGALYRLISDRLLRAQAWRLKAASVRVMACSSIYSSRRLSRISSRDTMQSALTRPSEPAQSQAAHLAAEFGVMARRSASLGRETGKKSATTMTRFELDFS
jgi:hypothetical protein